MYVGKVDNLGTDAVLAPMDPGDVVRLEETLATYLPPGLRKTKPGRADFKKVVSGRKLWNLTSGHGRFAGGPLACRNYKQVESLRRK